MRALRTLPVLLAVNLNFAPANGTSATIEVDKVAHPVHLEHVDGSPRKTPQLTPTKPSHEGEGFFDGNRRPSAVDLLALLPRAGGAKGVLRGKNKGKNSGIRLPKTEDLGKVVTVNVVSWAAVIGGTVLWSRTKTGPKEGLALLAET